MSDEKLEGEGDDTSPALKDTSVETEQISEQNISGSEIDSSGNGKRLTLAQWAEIDAHWEHGDMKASEIAAKYGVTPSALFQSWRKRKIVAGSKIGAMRAAAAAGITGAATSAAKSTFSQQRIERIESAKEVIYRNAMFSQQQMLRLKVDLKEGRISERDANDKLKNLRLAAIINKAEAENLASVLEWAGEVDRDELPELIIRDLTREEIKAARNRREDDELDDILNAPTPTVSEDEEVIVIGGE